jgi:hypothetical protein
MDHPSSSYLHIKHQAHIFGFNQNYIWSLVFSFPSLSHTHTFRTLGVQLVLQNLVQSMEQSMNLLEGRSGLLDVGQM